MLMNGDLVEDLKEFHQDNTVHFVIKLKEEIDKIERQEGGINKRFKMTTSLSANNMVLFGQNGRIKKY